jgi:hypothetical protein
MNEINDLNIILENIKHSFDISNISNEAKKFLEVFSEDEIICSTKYKNYNGLKYEYDESLKDKDCKIYLTNNYDDEDVYAIVSPEHFEELNKYKWNLNIIINKYNNIRKIAICNIDGYIHLMHILIKGYKKGLVVDHINGNTLDNRYENLRNATYKQNAQNKPKNINTSFKYIGVRFDDYLQKFCVNFSNIHIGYNINEIEAAKLYDTFVLLHPELGKHSKTNNLVDWNDVKDLNFDEVFPPKLKREYPKNISFKKNENKFWIRVQYKKNIYSEKATKLDEAIIIKQSFIENIENLKKEEYEKHLLNKIERNDLGLAIIKVNDLIYIIDDDDWHFITYQSWRPDKDNYLFNDKLGKLHRFLKKNIIDEIMLFYSDAELVIDHINNDIYDNRKCNLRLNSKSGNCHNKKLDNNSKYYNIFKTKNNTWNVKISKNYNSYQGGTYNTEIEAGIASMILDKLLYKNYSREYNISIEDFDKYKDNVINNLKWLYNKTPQVKWSGIKKEGKKYSASIKKPNQYIFLGSYVEKVEAAIAYNFIKEFFNEPIPNHIDEEDLIKYKDNVKEKIDKVIIKYDL